MPLRDSLIGPLTAIIDTIIPDKHARDRARLELLRLQGSWKMARLEARVSAIASEAGSSDRWTRRARPSFLYVMYAMILWAMPMGLIAAVSPATAQAITQGMTA